MRPVAITHLNAQRRRVHRRGALSHWYPPCLPGQRAISVPGYPDGARGSSPKVTPHGKTPGGIRTNAKMQRSSPRSAFTDKFVPSSVRGITTLIPAMGRGCDHP